MRTLLKCLKRTVLGAVILQGAPAISAAVTYRSMAARFKKALARGTPGAFEQARANGAGHESEDKSGQITDYESLWETENASKRGAEGNMGDIFEALEALPFVPIRPVFRAYLRAALVMTLTSLLDLFRRTAGYVYPYPRQFEKVTFRSLDGTELAAVVGLHRDERPRPGLVIAHGYGGCKNDHHVVSTALRAFAEWGFNVMALDFRDSGESRRLGFTPCTLGYREGEDLLAAAKYLGERPGVTTVGVTGFSMGAISSMRAAYLSGGQPYITGGAVAWNGVSDGRRIIRHLDTRPRLSDPYFIPYLGFRLSHRVRRWEMKRYVDDPGAKRVLDEPGRDYNFEKYLSGIASPHYGVSYDELLDAVSSRKYLEDLKVPLLVIHAADDPICPPSEMDDLMEIEERNPNLKVWMLPMGWHCGFMYLDRDWYDGVLRKFFSYWARRP